MNPVDEDFYLHLMPFFQGMREHGMAIYAAVAGTMGLVVGSFLNVVVYRWPRGLSLLRPSSRCPSCGHDIRARDNVPVLGWLRLRGRCRDCHAPISPRYALVEAFHGALWAAVGAWGYATLPATQHEAVNAGVILTFLVFASLLTVMAFIDLDVQLIPDEASLGGALFVFAASMMWPEVQTRGRAPGTWWFPEGSARVEALLQCVLGMAVGAGVVWVVTKMGTRLFRARLEALRRDDPELDTAVGFGDLKLMLLIGGYLGPGLTMAALLWTVYAGGLAGLLLKFVTGRWPEGASRWSPKAWRQRWLDGAPLMALGPYLALGGLVVAFGGDALTDRMWSWVFPPEPLPLPA